LLRAKNIDTFNIFVLHQNRVKHGDYAYISEGKLHKFLNLIIWGHEHECRITPEFNAEGGYFISQPGKIFLYDIYMNNKCYFRAYFSKFSNYKLN